MILCDGTCERAYHPECLNLSSIPEDEEWLCPYCTRQLAKKNPRVTVKVHEEESDEYLDTAKEREMLKKHKSKAKKKKEEDELYTSSQKGKRVKEELAMEAQMLMCPIDGCGVVTTTRTSMLSHV